MFNENAPPNSDADHVGEVQPRPLPLTNDERLEEGAGLAAEDDFELPAKACDLGRPEGCESCQ